jgi:putative RNA 2'-phosphotransferase
VLLEVDAPQMISEGPAFYCSDNRVWLTDVLPPDYLKVLP